MWLSGLSTSGRRAKNSHSSPELDYVAANELQSRGSGPGIPSHHEGAEEVAVAAFHLVVPNVLVMILSRV